MSIHCLWKRVINLKEETIKKAINLLNDNSNIPFNLLDKYDDSLEKIELYELKK